MNNKNNRPISPHLAVYRMQLTSILSIMHRVSGLFLFIGFLMLLWWLIYCINYYGQESVEALCVTSLIVDFNDDVVVKTFKHPIGKGILIIWSYALFYHLLAGIRHLVWDAGFGFKIKHVYLSGWSMVVGSLIIWGITWFMLLYCS